MKDAKKCQRCGERAESIDNIEETTFWGAIRTEVTTTTTVMRRVQLWATYYKRNPRFGSPVLQVDEKQALCSDCWGLLIGRFMQGRDVPAIEGKGGW